MGFSLFGYEGPARQSLGFVDEHVVHEMLEPVSGKARFADCITDVAAPARVFFVVGYYGVDGHGGGESLEEAKARRDNAGGAHFAHGGPVFEADVAMLDGVDNVFGDDLADDSRRHAGAGRSREDFGAVRTFEGFGDGVRGRKGDARGKDVFEAGSLVARGPILDAPVFIGLGGVVGVDFHEPVGQEHVGGDVGACAVVGFESDSGKRGNEHGEIEAEFVFAAIEGFVMDFAFFDLEDAGTLDPADAIFGEDGFGEYLGGGDVAPFVDIGAAAAFAFGVERDRRCLVELDAFAGIDRRQGKVHVFGFHAPDAYPDVRWNPLVVFGRTDG